MNDQDTNKTLYKYLKDKVEGYLKSQWGEPLVRKNHYEEVSAEVLIAFSKQIQKDKDYFGLVPDDLDKQDNLFTDHHKNKMSKWLRTAAFRNADKKNKKVIKDNKFIGEYKEVFDARAEEKLHDDENADETLTRASDLFEVLNKVLDDDSNGFRDVHRLILKAYFDNPESGDRKQPSSAVILKFLKQTTSIVWDDKKFYSWKHRAFEKLKKFKKEFQEKGLLSFLQSSSSAISQVGYRNGLEAVYQALTGKASEEQQSAYQAMLEDEAFRIIHDLALEEAGFSKSGNSRPDDTTALGVVLTIFIVAEEALTEMADSSDQPDDEIAEGSLMKDELSELGFRKIGEYLLSDREEVVRRYEEGVQASERLPLVYAITSGDLVAYFGHTKIGYRRPMGFHKRNWANMSRVIDGIEKTLLNGQTVEVFARSDELTMEREGMTISLPSAIAEALTEKHAPIWNSPSRPETTT